MSSSSSNALSDSTVETMEGVSVPNASSTPKEGKQPNTLPLSRFLALETSVKQLNSTITSLANRTISMSNEPEANSSASHDIQGASSDGFDPDANDPDESVDESGVEAEREENLALVFEGDEDAGPALPPKIANYVQGCASKRIDKDKLSDIKKRYPRPENCEALCVPQINQGIWKELSSRHRSMDIHVQATQGLVAKGLSAVLVAKEDLRKATSNANQEPFSKVHSELNDAIALLGNAHLQLSHRRRELLRPGINPKYQSLCNSSQPVSTMLFGDKVQDTLKDMNEMAKLSRSISSRDRYHPYEHSDRNRDNSYSQSGNRSLNRRGRSAPSKGQSWKNSSNSQNYRSNARHNRSEKRDRQ